MMTNRLTLAIIVASILTIEGASVKANATLLSSRQPTQNLLPTSTNTESFNRRLNRNPQSLFLGLIYLAVPASDTDTLVCYIQTADGRTLNLGELCRDPIAENVRRLLTSHQCQNCDLSGANLVGADLHDTDLRGANLAGADLSSANLVGANLDGVDINRANLVGANLDGAILDSANLQRSHSKHPHLSSF